MILLTVGYEFFPLARLLGMFIVRNRVLVDAMFPLTFKMTCGGHYANSQ